MIDFKEIMKDLSAERQVFHSEADFQFALAWKIKEKIKDISIRLEKCIDTMYVDIIAEYDNKLIPIELKYKTRNASKNTINVNNEIYRLKNQGAHDQARYDFIKDIFRIENMIVKNRNCEYGYAIMLTNDHLYWNNKANENRETICDSFRIHENRELKSVLDWSEKASEGSKKGRDRIILNGSYILNWKDYSKIDDNRFRYLILEVDKSHF